MATTFSGNWWALALRAGAAIVLGILAFTMPGATLTAIVVLFGIYAIIDGVFALIAAFRGLRMKERWGAMMFEGVVGIAAGVVALVWPAIGALTLLYLVAVWALLTGALEIAMAIRLRKIMTGEWLLILGGIVSIVLAFLLTLFPGTGVTALVWWLGIYALAYGVINLALAVRVRRWTTLNP
jgi:uncharacterized membrane protein HdeD (DUF308 family)